MRERSNKECETDLECFFSVQRLHGFRQVVTHVQSQQKDELQLSCKAVYLSIATKALVVDMVATPWARHILTTRLHPQNPAFPHLRSTHLRTRSTFTDVGLPSGFSNPLSSWRQALSEQGCRNCILPPPNSACFLWKQSRHRKKAPTVAMARFTPAGCRINRS